MDGVRRAGLSENWAHAPCLSPVHPSMSPESPLVEGYGCWKVGFEV